MLNENQENFPGGQLHIHTCVGPHVHVGDRTVVWQFATIIRQARIGEDCVVGAGAIVDGASVGDRCKLGAHCQLHPGTRVLNDVFVGPGSVFCNDRWPRVDTTNWDVAGKTTVLVQDLASIGANATILPGVVIGLRAMVAAGAVVDRHVPPWHLFKRNGDIVKIDRREISDRAREARW